MKAMVMKRNGFLFVCILMLLSCTSKKKPVAMQEGHHLYLLIGSYSDGTTPGLSVYDFEVDAGGFEYISDIRNIPNPSYLAISPDEQMVYSVNETQEGAVSAFRFDKENGLLHFVNSQPTAGADPCYILINQENKYIATANYSGGNISVFPLNPDGSIEPLSFTINLNNPEPSPVSHIHTTIFSPDGKYMLATDLGKDKIYRFKTGKNSNDAFLDRNIESVTELEPGSGPRHLAFHPNGKYLYCINELSGKVAVFAYKEETIEWIQSIASDTTQESGRKGSADVHLTPDGKFLYASNRLKADGIAVFFVDPDNGRLTSIGYQKTGIHPRNFIISPNGKFLLCANRDMNTIQIFKIDPITGLLHNTGKEIATNNPVCLKWVKK